MRGMLRLCLRGTCRAAVAYAQAVSSEGEGSSERRGGRRCMLLAGRSGRPQRRVAAGTASVGAMPVHRWLGASGVCSSQYGRAHAVHLRPTYPRPQEPTLSIVYGERYRAGGRQAGSIIIEPRHGRSSVHGRQHGRMLVVAGSGIYPAKVYPHDNHTTHHDHVTVANVQPTGPPTANARQRLLRARRATV
jgi:hypothetical protein